MHDFIGKQVQRVNRNFLIATLLLLAVPAVTAAFSYKWAYNVFFGPFPIQASELEKVQDLGGRWENYFTVKADPGLPALDTGAREGTKKKGMTTKWLVLPAGRRLLFVQAPIGHEGDEYVGYLAPLRDADKDLINQLDGKSPGLKRTLLPYKLNSEYGYRGQFAAMAGVLVVPFLLGALWVFGVFLLRRLAPDRHPVLRALAPYGEPGEVRKQIEADFDGPTLRIGRLQLTRDWLLSVRSWGLDVARVEDVVWAYKRVVRGEGASISAMICTRQGATFGIQGKDKDVDAMLKVLTECVPWALFGYDPRLDTFWSSEPQKLAAIVDERRRQFQAAPGTSPPEPPPAGPDD
jgi:hypothetical protein